MDVYGERSRAGPQQPTLNSSYPSQRPNGELPSQLKMVSSRQPDTLPFHRKRSAHRTKTQSRRLDTIIRHALRQSLQSGLLKLQTQSAGMEPLVQSFNGKITKQSGWYEELGYIPRDDLECKSQILYWQDGASSCTLTVHITAEPTVDGMNAQVRLDHPRQACEMLN